MPIRPTNVLLLAAAVGLLVCTAGAMLVVSSAWTKPAEPSNGTQITPSRTGRNARNLRLQPEAFQLSRRLGNRYTRLASSVAIADLTVGTNRQSATVIRRQTDSGETIDVTLAGRTLTWSYPQGVTASSVVADAERLLMERLTFDSPDQFVLAQLRGASYFTVAQNVRPTDASDGYSGPAWRLIRVSEPRVNENTSATNSWRIYHVNSLTGLIDRIVSELNGQTIEAQILEWVDDSGEKFPAHIRWSANGEIIMDYRVTAVSLNE